MEFDFLGFGLGFDVINIGTIFASGSCHYFIKIRGLIWGFDLVRSLSPVFMVLFAGKFELTESWAWCCQVCEVPILRASTRRRLTYVHKVARFTNVGLVLGLGLGLVLGLGNTLSLNLVVFETWVFGLVI